MAGIASQYATSKNKLGVALGLSGRQIANLIDEGMPAKTDAGFDIDACRQWLADKRKPKEKPLASYDERMAAAELRKIEAEALTKELKAQQVEGKLIDREEAFMWACQLCATIATRLDQMPEEITTELPPDIRQTMKERIVEKLDLVRQTMANERLPGIKEAVFVA